MGEAGKALEQARVQLAQAGQPGDGEENAGQVMVATEGDPGTAQAGGAAVATGAHAGEGASGIAGRGTTNQREEGGRMGEGRQEGRQSAERPDGRSSFEQIYAPRRVDTQRLDARVRGQQGSGPSASSPTRGLGDGGAAHQPYYKVYSSYRSVAEEALSREEVPAGYRKQVRDYFESLRP